MRMPVNEPGPTHTLTRANRLHAAVNLSQSARHHGRQRFGLAVRHLLAFRKQRRALGCVIDGDGGRGGGRVDGEHAHGVNDGLCAERAVACGKSLSA